MEILRFQIKHKHIRECHVQSAGDFTRAFRRKILKVRSGATCSAAAFSRFISVLLGSGKILSLRVPQSPHGCVDHCFPRMLNAKECAAGLGDEKVGRTRARIG
jgi:hypothetical protein